MLAKAVRSLVRATPVAASAARTGWRKVQQATLVLAGFGAIDYGVYQWSAIAGWITGGVLILCFGALLDSADTPVETNTTA